MAIRKGTGTTDDLLGTGQSDFLYGVGGNDALNGSGGNDTLDGGFGDDNLIGGSGNDRLLGGAGNDRMNGGAANDRLSGGAGDDIAAGGSGNDIVNGGSGQDFLLGGGGDDKLVWDPRDFSVNGGLGFDTLDVGGATVNLIGKVNLRDVEAINMHARGANTLVANAASVVSATDSQHLLRIFGDSNDALELTGIWNRVRSPVAGYSRYISGDAKVDVENTVSVTFGNHLSLANLNGVNGIHIKGANVLATSAGDVNGDGFDDLLLGAPTSVLGADAGSAYVIFGQANGIAADIDLAHLKARQGVRLAGTKAEHYTGVNVSIVGDLNHDGFDDLAVAAANFDLNFSSFSSMNSYIVFGHGGGYPAAFAMNRVNGDNGYILDGIPIDDMLANGLPLSAAGDFNGDGFEDFALGVPTAFTPGGGMNAGSTFIVFGSAAPYDTSVDIRVMGPGEAWRINGAHDTAGVGTKLTSGDINGDGFDDVLMSSGQGNDPAYVVFGKATGFDSDLSVASLSGSDGFAVTSLHAFSHIAVADLNGDGFDDIVMQNANINAYSVRVVFGHGGPFASTVSADVLNGANGFSIVAPGGEHLGFALSSAGDINGDGYEDLLLGVSNANANHQFRAGATYVVFGHGGTFDAQLNLAQMDISQGLRIDGFAKNQFSGASVSAAGDINGDGYGDISIASPGLFGTPNSIPPDGTYVVYGRDFSHGVAFNGTAGNDVVNGTVRDEALVGGRGSDVLNGGGGSDSLIGGANNDILVWDAADHRIDGGSGFDTLRFDGAAQTLDFTLLPSKIITDINLINLTGSGDNHLRLSLQDLLQATDHAALRVAGDAGDSVELTTPGWTQIADRSVEGNGYHAYIHGTATLLIDADITQTVT